MDEFQRGRGPGSDRGGAPTRAQGGALAESILEHVNTALLVVDPDGRILVANTMAERILEGRGGSLAGRSLWDWFPHVPRDEVPVALCLREGRRLRGVEVVLTRVDGERLPIGISCSPLLDAAGTRVGAVAVFQDLTEVKRLRQQVLQTEKMASIGRLAAGVAHEINNPMGFIHANLFQMQEYLEDLRRVWSAVGELRQRAASLGPDDVRKAAERLEALERELGVDALLEDFATAIQESQEGSERIRHIVRDLRTFSHQNGERRMPTDLNECLESTANLAAATMKHGATLRKEYGDLPPVLCDPMQMKQVFLNLVVNAYQAVRERFPGGGTPGEIRLRTEPAAGGVRIQVWDNGVGIAAEHAARVFDPFFTTKEVGVGTGLGLATSYQIVRRHGGTLRVESDAGEGACFEVWLPQGEAAPSGEDR